MKVFLKIFAEFNLGDDLFLKIILERYPQVQFILNAKEDYKIFEKKYDNLFVYSDKDNRQNLTMRGKRFLLRRLFPKLYRKSIIKDIENNHRRYFLESDVFVSIGGSIFMQPKMLPAYLDVEYYNIVNSYFKYSLFLGCNFGPYNDSKYQLSYTNIFQNAYDVCFREKFSWEIFSELKTTRFKPDIVLNLDFKKSNTKEKSVGFSVISPRDLANKSKYIDKYVELVQFYQDEGYDIYLFSFCKQQKDEETILNIISNIKHSEKIHKVFYSGDIDAFLRIYSAMEMMYCGRFHSIILSMLFKQRIYPIIYSNKMTNVLADFNYKGKVVAIEDFYKCKPQQLHSEIKDNAYDIIEEVKESVKQFEKLDYLINSKVV